MFPRASQKTTKTTLVYCASVLRECSVRRLGIRSSVAPVNPAPEKSAHEDKAGLRYRSVHYTVRGPDIHGDPTELRQRKYYVQVYGIP